MKFGESFNSYLEVVENKTVTICPKCGSGNSTNYDWLGKASCFNCGHTEWEKKFKYKTIGLLN